MNLYHISQTQVGATTHSQMRLWRPKVRPMHGQFTRAITANTMRIKTSGIWMPVGRHAVTKPYPVLGAYIAGTWA